MVLVYPGSATDLLEVHAFRQMKNSLDRLSSADIILFGFNKATTMTMGDITLPFRAGPVVQQVLCLVFEDMCLYNAIIGRA